MSGALSVHTGASPWHLLQKIERFYSLFKCGTGHLLSRPLDVLSVLEDRQTLGEVEMLRKDSTWGFIEEKIVTPGPLGKLVRSLEMNMQAR